VNKEEALVRVPLFGGHDGGHRIKFLKTGEYFYTEKVRKKARFLSKSGLFGGDKRDRTADLLNAIQCKNPVKSRLFRVIGGQMVVVDSLFFAPETGAFWCYSIGKLVVTERPLWL
jgi:hypothetical protein